MSAAKAVSNRVTPRPNGIRETLRGLIQDPPAALIFVELVNDRIDP